MVSLFEMVDYFCLINDLFLVCIFWFILVIGKYMRYRYIIGGISVFIYCVGGILINFRYYLDN